MSAFKFYPVLQPTSRMTMFIDRLVAHIKGLSPQQRMLVSIAYSDAILKKHFELILDKYSLTPPQYNLLRILEGVHPKHCTVSELKEMIIDKKSDVSRMIERLRKEGFVVRNVSKDDARMVEILITGKGLSVINEIRRKEEANMFNPFSHITDTEAEQLNVLLQKVIEGLRAVNFPE